MSDEATPAVRQISDRVILSHYHAGTGAVLIETREERRVLAAICGELPQKAAAGAIGVVAAPSGPLRDASTGEVIEGITGLAAAYQWAQQRPGRVLVVYDWHVLANTPGHWRALAEAIPRLRQPVGAGVNDSGSLVVFVGPHWELRPENPLRRSFPVIQFAAPRRDVLAKLAGELHPLDGHAAAVADSLAGLTADAAEQAAAECLAARKRWDTDYLRGARRQLLREAGLEIWPAVADLGGLAGLREYAESEIVPWIRDDQLAVRRILCAGVPGVGKSYCARWLAGRLGCECARLSVPALKAGLVGASEANLRRALRALDALGAEAPVVCVIDEIDAAVQRDGLDSGVSAGLFSELLTWLQESTARCVVLATLNHLDSLDAAIESRFQARFFFDLPTRTERAAVAEIHYRRLGCVDRAAEAAMATADAADQFSSREIAEHVVPSVCRRSRRQPTRDVIDDVCAGTVPASRTQSVQLEKMRTAAVSLRRANDIEVVSARNGRIISGDAS